MEPRPVLSKDEPYRHHFPQSQGTTYWPGQSIPLKQMDSVPFPLTPESQDTRVFRVPSARFRHHRLPTRDPGQREPRALLCIFNSFLHPPELCWEYRGEARKRLNPQWKINSSLAFTVSLLPWCRLTTKFNTDICRKRENSDAKAPKAELTLSCRVVRLKPGMLQKSSTRPDA